MKDTVDLINSIPVSEEFKKVIEPLHSNSSSKEIRNIINAFNKIPVAQWDKNVAAIEALLYCSWRITEIRELYERHN